MRRRHGSKFAHLSLSRLLFPLNNDHDNWREKREGDAAQAQAQTQNTKDRKYNHPDETPFTRRELPGDMLKDPGDSMNEGVWVTSTPTNS
jgi:hypothetical protein